ncbi:MAG: peptidylprolyl isomerase [Muribaculaceae bacterium]|nr:peptidylprolyl isomerase [Muribaculaceae bacterium]
MKKIIITLIAATAVMAAGAKSKAPKDPVLMTVGDEKVTLSEFEYYYHKNNDQQLDRQSLEEYLEMFKTYKLKVAEARHQRVDTAASFQKEFQGYRADLVAPYLRDTLVDRKLVDDAYAHMLEQVKIHHMMLPLDKKALADSIRAVLVANPTSFVEVAMKHSTDPSLAQNKSDYSWLQPGYPWEFEEGVYNTPVGEISEVISTRFGNHIVRVDDRRPNAGEVQARHILISYPTERTPENIAAAKARIDSIHSALKNGADFAELAKALSNCPSSAQGGDLGWFGRGAMVPEFEQTVFDMNDGDISEPFTTKFGWHIVQRTGTRPIAEKAKYEQAIRRAIEHDSRSQLAVKSKAAQLAKEYNASILPEGLEHIRQILSQGGYVNNKEKLAADTTPLITVGDSTVTIADFMTPEPRVVFGTSEFNQISEMIDNRLEEVVLTYENHRLEAKHPELRNLVKEYYDGMMLFEVSNQNVWNMPASNPEGLEEYFKQHRQKYMTWDAPRFKGFIIYATSDSLVDEVNKYLAANNIKADEVGDKLKEAFPRNIKIERVLLPQGKNAVVDYFGFGGEKPDLKRERRWTSFTSYLGRIIDQPEEAADCRSAVSADYQEELTRQWVDHLREIYPIKVNKKVLKKVKQL